MCVCAQRDLCQLPGFGAKKAASVLKGIEASKALPMEVFLAGLGIRSVGKGTAEQLALSYPTLELLLAAADMLPGEVGANLSAWFANSDNKLMLNQMAVAGVRCVRGAQAGAGAGASLKSEGAAGDMQATSGSGKRQARRSVTKKTTTFTKQQATASTSSADAALTEQQASTSSGAAKHSPPILEGMTLVVTGGSMPVMCSHRHSAQIWNPAIPCRHTKKVATLRICRTAGALMVVACLYSCL